jgi:hypothetical protein
MPQPLSLLRDFLKTKFREKQCPVRLAVIAGSTLVIGTTFAFVCFLMFQVEPRSPEGFVKAAIIGAVLLICSTITARIRKNPIYEMGRRTLVYCVIGVLAGGYLFFPQVAKPVIYLYPQQPEDVLVQLEYDGGIVADYPAMDPVLGGWRVTAYPDSRLIDHQDGREYSYLFWEGTGKTDWDMSSGFVVAGSDTREFLQDTLPKLGLTPKEYNEFIVYWYPLMQGNRFNLIHFAGSEYTDMARLTITPWPDSVIRVFMVWKPLRVKVSVPAQQFAPVERKGFTVVEWGGTEIR